MIEPKVRICACPGCKVEVKPGQLACREHWGALPSDLRDRLVDAWEKRKANPDVPELVYVHRALLLECLKVWGIKPEDMAKHMRYAPRVVQTSCPFCGAGGGLHRPGCPRIS